MIFSSAGLVFALILQRGSFPWKKFEPEEQARTVEAGIRHMPPLASSSESDFASGMPEAPVLRVQDKLEAASTEYIDHMENELGDYGEWGPKSGTGSIARSKGQNE